jgi:lipopolysaccharide transport system ATP-binding protein
VELYIDTPVKRYSSGMYVRLAFAVAAHLEPEILIVDEVLAVGDAEFQKKCLGKMGDVASHGRTIIFVSHNMQAVQSLCRTALFLKNGQIADAGRTDKVINNYLSRELRSNLSKKWEMEGAPGNNFVKVLRAEIINKSESDQDNITVHTPIDIAFEFYLNTETYLNLSLLLFTASGNCIFNVGTKSALTSPGLHTSTLKIPGNLLNDELYSINLLFVKDTSTHLFGIDDLLSFEVVEGAREGNWYGKWLGAVRPSLEFSLT